MIKINLITNESLNFKNENYFCNNKEIQDKLNGENWPIKRGDIGENFTISGIVHSHFSPGQQFQLGECILEISFECDPCHNLAVLPYVGEDKLNEFIKTLMHRRGWYAKVIKEGTVKTGDPIQQLK